MSAMGTMGIMTIIVLVILIIGVTIAPVTISLVVGVMVTSLLVSRHLGLPGVVTVSIEIISFWRSQAIVPGKPHGIVNFELLAGDLAKKIGKMSRDCES